LPTLFKDFVFELRTSTVCRTALYPLLHLGNLTFILIFKAIYKGLAGFENPNRLPLI
jgi:hypothetical protein